MPDNKAVEKSLRYALWLVIFACALQAQLKPVAPASGAPAAGPFSPGVIADGYLYVSGQGAKTAAGTLPETFEAQMRQSLDNVKAVVEAAGLTLENVVYAHLYLEDLSKLAEADRIWAEYFGKTSPARAVVGVAHLPGTPVEIDAVAVIDRAGRTAVTIPGFEKAVYPAGVLTRDRLFISTVTGTPNAAPEEEVASALDSLKAVTVAAGLTMKNLVFVSPYLTSGITAETLDTVYARRFEFGTAPARASLTVNELPVGHIAFTGIAVRDLGKRLVVRPANMAANATDNPCVYAGDTLYCSAKSGVIPGPHTGIYAATLQHQMRQTFRNLLDNLEEAGMAFKNVAATNVYLDNIEDFAAMNTLYEQYFLDGWKPARTTIQPAKPGPREPDAEQRYPAFEQISFIAVR